MTSFEPRARPSWRRRWYRWLWPSWGMLRLGVYATCVFAASTAGAAGLLYGKVREVGLAGGAELSRFADLTAGGETISLNGERLHRSSAFTKESVGAVLDRIQSYCEEKPTFVARALSGLPAELSSRAEQTVPSRLMRLGIVREESRGRGMVACFIDKTSGRLVTFESLMARFLETHRMSIFGGVRYVYAEPAGGGRTHVVAFWGDGDLDVARMFPAAGDAAGSDSALLPRPPDARRTLAAGAEGQPYAVRLYVSNTPVPALQTFYDDSLRKQGWRVVPTGEGAGGATTYLRDDGLLAIVVLSARAGRSYVSLVEAGRADAPGLARGDVTLPASQ